MVKRVRIDLAYDGGPFAGFARQPGFDTVQGTLEGALSRVVRHDVNTTCAGRTDRGVHALAQVVHVDLDPQTPRTVHAVADLDVLRDRLDHSVGDAITIWRVLEVDETFDARFSPTWRAYRYRMSAVLPDPRTRNVVWWPGELDVEVMADALTVVRGEHDFTSFCRQAVGRSNVRNVMEAEVAAAGDEVHVTMRGSSFCHQQVRAIVGSLVEVGRGRRDVAWFAEALAARDRSVCGPVAPPQGLTLEAIGYPDPWPDAPAWGSRT